MKRLLLTAIIALFSSYAFSQAPTYVGKTNNTTIIRNQLQINGLISQYNANKVLTITNNGLVQLVTPSGGGGGIVFPNLAKYYVNGFGVAAATNTDSIGIEGATNKWYSNARVQTFGDGRYSLLAHNHILDNLSNVSITSKSIGDVLQWNGSNWVNAVVSGGGGSTITLSGDISGVGTTSITTTIGTGVVINNKLANVNTNTFKGRITAGTGAPEDLTVNQTKTILGITNVDNTSDISKPISTAAQNLFDLKAPLASPALSGVPTAPTAANGTNTTQIATTAFVIANTGGGSGYTLPIATNSVLGGVKIGSNVGVAPDGTISVAFPVASFNGRTGAIVPTQNDYTFAQLSTKPTTLAGYGITDALTQALADTRYSLLGHVHTASDITSGVFSTTRLATGSGTSATYLRGDGIWSTLTQSSIPNLVSDLALKAPLVSPTFTGTVTLPKTTNATLNTDTLALFTFGAGGALAGDTASFSTSTIYGSLLHSGSDTVVVTSVNIVLQGTSPSITVDTQFGATFNSGGTSVIPGGSATTSTAGVTTSGLSVKIPPGRYIWCKTPVVTTGSKPTYLAVTIMGYKIRK